MGLEQDITNMAPAPEAPTAKSSKPAKGAKAVSMEQADKGTDELVAEKAGEALAGAMAQVAKSAVDIDSKKINDRRFDITIDESRDENLTEFGKETLTDRYLLVHDRDKPLALNVIDSYQAGEIRSTRNLSGGESFIVSLALALGLSRMASRNVRIDSLFLDEGFGTLDEAALDTALDMLAGLQQDGKLIGVISHVPMLKARISTQIEVIPQTGGRSRIVGPGVQCLGER